MYAVILAGKDAGVDPGSLKRWESAEGERYLWGEQNKALRILEDLQHQRFRPIDRTIANLEGAGRIDGYVVVASPDVREYLGPREYVVPQGANVGENMRLGRQRLRELYGLQDYEFSAVISSDTVFAGPETIDDMVAKLGGQLEALEPRPHQVLTFVERSTNGRLPRAYFPAYNDLTRHSPLFTGVKEANLQFITMHTNFQMLNNYYSFRKQKNRSNQWGLLRVITRELGPLHTLGLLALAVRAGLENRSPRLGISLRRFAEGMAELHGETPVDGCWPLQLLESRWWQFSYDGDSQHDDARYDFTEVPNLEYKLRVAPRAGHAEGFLDHFGRRGLFKQYFDQFSECEAGFLGGFSEPAVFAKEQGAVNVVTRWVEKGARQAFWKQQEFRAMLEQASDHISSLQHLGWYGGA